MNFPESVPETVEPLLWELIHGLGPIVPAKDGERILSLWGELALLEVASIGLEVNLTQGEYACDASVLLNPRNVPPGLSDADTLLHALARDASQNHHGTVWWEFDASKDHTSMATFWRTSEGNSNFERLQGAVSKDPGLSTALATLAPWFHRWNEGVPGLVGVFPSRKPASAGLLMPIHPEYITPALERLSKHALCVSITDPRVEIVRETCTSFSLAIGADSQGRMSVSLEGGFLDRENAMLRGDWAKTFSRPTLWGCPETILERLLATQGQRRYALFPPLSILTGIDHIKISPGGRVKAYVGALPLGAAVLNVNTE